MVLVKKDSIIKMKCDRCNGLGTKGYEVKIIPNLPYYNGGKMLWEKRICFKCEGTGTITTQDYGISNTPMEAPANSNRSSEVSSMLRPILRDGRRKIVNIN